MLARVHLLLLSFVLSGCTGSPTDLSDLFPVLGSTVEVAHLSVEGKPSAVIALTVPLVRAPKSDRFLNVVVDFNADGAMQPSEWVVANQPIPPMAAAAAQNLFIEIPAGATLPDKSVSLQVAASRSPVADSWDGKQPADGELVVASSTVKLVEAKFPAFPSSDRVGSGLGEISGVAEPLKGDQASVPDAHAHIDESAAPFITLTQVGDTCFATSIASSLGWLVTRESCKYKRVLGRDVTSLGDLTELAADITARAQKAGVLVKGGAAPDKIFKMKKDIVTEANLGVETTRVPAADVAKDVSIVSTIADAINRKCAVEGIFRIYVTLSGVRKPAGYHMVAISGVDVKSSKGSMQVRDSNTPTAEKASTDDSYKLDLRADQAPILTKFPFTVDMTGTGKTFGLHEAELQFVLVECPKPDGGTICFNDPLGEIIAPQIGPTNELVPLTPKSDWPADGGEVNPPCDPPNPAETSFAATGGGASISVQSANCACCSCARRTGTYVLPREVTTTSASLYGLWSATRGANDKYSLGSMRIDLYYKGSPVAKKLYAAESRPNNNCAGDSEKPEEIIKPGSFQVMLAYLKMDAMIDEVRVRLQGYGCCEATATAKLTSLSLIAPPAP
jgi:hypothetical protein